LAHLPPGLDGLRIVHLSDIHIGDFMPRAALRRAVDLINAVQPDLAVLTGDLISHEHDPLEDCIAELSRLRAPLGVWGCHGNHERWAGPETRAQALFARYGMHVLRQQCVELSWHGGRFNLIGVDDQRERARPGEPSSMLRGLTRLVRPDIPHILLSHNPDTFPRAAALGIELSLAGHTHGGQIRLTLGIGDKFRAGTCGSTRRKKSADRPSPWQTGECPRALQRQVQRFGSVRISPGSGV